MKQWFLRVYDRVFPVPFSYRDRNGVRRICRLIPEKLDGLHNDPMTVAYGVDTGEFINQWRKRDIAEGCPYCLREVYDNLSEPDVLQRWELWR